MTRIARRGLTAMFAFVLAALFLTVAAPANAADGGRVYLYPESPRSAVRLCVDWGTNHCLSTSAKPTIGRGQWSSGAPHYLADTDGFFIPSGCKGWTLTYQTWNGNDGWVYSYAPGDHKINNAQSVRLKITC